jgi:hypothetical protein
MESHVGPLTVFRRNRVLHRNPKNFQEILACIHDITTVFRSFRFVGIAQTVRLGNGQAGFDSWQEILSYPPSSYLPTSNPPCSIRCIPEVKLLMCETSHSSASSVGVKNEWSYSSIPSHVFVPGGLRERVRGFLCGTKELWS